MAEQPSCDLEGPTSVPKQSTTEKVRHLLGGGLTVSQAARELNVSAATVSSARFNELIHAPTRLAIVALLAATEWAEFTFIRHAVNASDSALSKQISTLAQAGYLDVRKTSGRRRRTLVRLSPDGRQAFEAHVNALENLIAGARAGTAETVGQGHPQSLPESEEQVLG